MISSEFPERLAALRRAAGLTQEQLAEKVGRSSQSISYWETGRNAPNGKLLVALCEALGCSEADLFGFSGSQPSPTVGIRPSTSTATAPVVGRIAAGDPREAYELADEAHYIDPAILERYPSGFFLVVAGDSMDRVLPDGCYAYIAVGEYSNGDVCAVKVNGDEATIKRVLIYDGIVVLQPESWSELYKRTIIDTNDPDAPDVRILGKVVWFDCTL